jgi:cell division protease FtsH
MKIPPILRRFLKGGPGSILLFIALFIISITLLTQLTDSSRSTQVFAYSEFLKKVEQNQVKDVVIEGMQVFGVLKDGNRFEATIAEVPSNWDLLRAHNVEFKVQEPSAAFSFWPMLIIGLFALLLFIMWFVFSQARGGGSSNSSSNIFSMGKSKARLFLPSQIKINFNSVAGAIEAKEDLADMVDFLKNPEKYRKLGARLTRGVLLVGEPGNGKTLLAKAVAGEANCPFFSISGSDFIEVFVGVGAARVRDLFAQARKHAPSIIFIDEIDAVGRQRGNGLGGGNDEREQTLNQLLAEMDGFETVPSSVVVIAATNRPDVLDKALLRPGRFDRRVEVPFPDLASRQQVLKVHVQGVKIDPSIDLMRIARGTPGFSGADLEHLVNAAAINASKKNQEQVTMADFEEARDRILLGKEMKTKVMSPDELKITAFHEAGHALMVLLHPEHADPLHKVTITPRGHSLGVTAWLPERDKYISTQQEMLTRIMVGLGGRAAEDLIFNIKTTGASSDLRGATDVARQMIMTYGMSPELGMAVYRQQPDDYQYSQESARRIDESVKRMLDDLYGKVVALLKTNRDKLDRLATTLLEKETLEAHDIYELLSIEPRTEFRLE